MADQPTRQLSEYIHAVSFPRLTAETVRETKRHIIDSVGCAIGGFSAPPSIIARRMAEQTQGHLKAGVLGEQWKTSPELAAFANGVMTRYLDFNDTYPGGHPSDGLGALQGLADALGSDAAIWVGHDWGSPTVWNIASHHPDRCRAVASLCVPYATLEYGVDQVIELVDRNVYPVDEYPVGQWDYQLYYQECFEQAQATMEADVESTLKALFRAGNADAIGKPAMTALIRASGGWFGGADRAPDLPLDPRVISVSDLAVYSEALRGSGFFGANSYYMNHEVNTAYAKTALDEGRLSMPALFIAARYDSVCESVDSPLTRPMRAKCSNLTESIVDSGHWMAQECPGAVNDVLETWLTEHVGSH